jgi:hypothetical protein
LTDAGAALARQLQRGDYQYRLAVMQLNWINYSGMSFNGSLLKWYVWARSPVIELLDRGKHALTRPQNQAL